MVRSVKNTYLESSPLNGALNELESILDEAGPEIRQLFGSSLTIFAGTQSASTSLDQKHKELEILITRAK